MNTSDQDDWHRATKMVRSGLQRSGFQETAEAIYPTSGFVYDTAEEAEEAFIADGLRFVYSRYANPTMSMLEGRLAALEGARFCRTTASGMAAIFAALMACIQQGDRIVASRALFGSSLHILNELLPRFGITAQLVDGTDYDQWRDALKTSASVLLLETPSNPTLDVIDLRQVCDMAHAAGATVIVDNVFATPVLQRPLEYGADVVVYSTTKHMDGQGRVLGGAILGNDEAWFNERLNPFLRNTGPAMSPFNAWVIVKGLETLEIRLRQQSANALAVARFLEDECPDIARVLYPGLASHPQHELAMAQMDGVGGTIVTFDLPGGKPGTFKVMNALSIIDISNNLGDTKSLITHPATTTHSKVAPEARAAAGIFDGTVRLSVGLEDPRDLIKDIARALETV